MPEISIALARYIGANCTEAQLRRYTEQTIVSDELVVCDDGSKGNTLEMIVGYGKTVPFRIHVYKNETQLGFVKN